MVARVNVDGGNDDADDDDNDEDDDAKPNSLHLIKNQYTSLSNN